MTDPRPNSPLRSDDSTPVVEATQDTGTYRPGEGEPTRNPLPPVHCGETLPELIGHPRYHVLGLIGAGGMGCVYKARHQFMDRLVALKVINHYLINQPAMIARFLQEVKAAARLDHPNIVRAYDADEAGGLYFLVMEYVSGVNLDQVLAEQGRLPIPLACDYARQVAQGLQHAYERGMVHRDVKPHNLMLTDEGRIKILDFGLARYVSEAAPIAAPEIASPYPESVAPVEASPNGSTAPARKQRSGATSSYAAAGTPDYMAPEEIRDPRQADIRADIYSLGCTLYRFLTGQVPFPGPNPIVKARSHLEREPEPLALLRPEAPPDLVCTVERMMAKTPAQRPQTPAQAAQALARFAGGTKPRILIVDDEMASRVALAMALEDEGYTVGCAADGREALERLRGQAQWDLIVLDMLMPVMDGWQFLQTLKGEPQLADIPVVVLSGAKTAQARALTLGVADYFQKPFPVEELATKIRRHTSAKPPASALSAGSGPGEMDSRPPVRGV